MLEESGGVDLSSPFYSDGELLYIGFASVGKNCRVSRKCSLYNISGALGSNVRVDDFCILKGEIHLGDCVHINAFNMLGAVKAPITFKGFCGTGSHVSIFTGSDDHRANTLNNACVPRRYTTQIEGPVSVGVGVIIGSHIAIMPNVKIGDGASIGAGCTVASDVPDGGMLRVPKAVLLDRRRDVKLIVEMGIAFLESDDGEV